MASCIAGNAELRNNMSLHKEISFGTAWLQLLKIKGARHGLFGLFIIMLAKVVAGNRKK